MFTGVDLKKIAVWLRLHLEHVLFYALVFLIPLSAGTELGVFGEIRGSVYASAVLYLSDAFVLVLLLVWMLRVAREHKLTPRSAVRMYLAQFLRLEWGYLLLPTLLVLSVVSTIGAQSVGAGVYRTAKFFEFVLLFFYLRNNFGRMRPALCLKIFVSSALVQSALIFFQYSQEQLVLAQAAKLKGLFFAPTNLLRASGTFELPFLLAGFVSVAALVVYFFIIKERFFFDLPNPEFLSPVREQAVVRHSFKRIGFVVAFFVLVLALTLSLTRSTMALFVGAFFVLSAGLLFDRRTRETFSLRIGYLSLVFVISLVLVSGLLWPELSVRFSPSQEAVSTPSRIIFDREAFSLLKERPRFGFGPGNYIFYVAQAGSLEEDVYLQPISNIYWLVALEGGITSLVVLVAFFAWFVSRVVGLLLRQESTFDAAVAWGLLVGTVFLLADAFFSHAFVTTQAGMTLFWGGLGAGAYWFDKDFVRSA